MQAIVKGFIEMEATVGLYGEMQGIAGKSVLEIEGFRLEDP